MPVTIPALGASSSYRPFAASGAQLEERRARVEEAVDPLADRQLAALAVPGDRPVVAARAALADGRRPAAELRDEGRHPLDVGARVVAGGIEPAAQDGHGRRIAPRSGRDRRGTGAARAPSWRHGHHARPPARPALSRPAPRPADPPGSPVLRDRERRRCSPAATPRRTWPCPAPGRSLTVRMGGGMCMDGPCDSARDPRARRPRPQRREAAERPRARLGRGATRPSTPRSRRPTSPRCARSPFTGECPIAFDGQEQIFEFSVGGTTQRLASCESDIDWGSPLFIAVAPRSGSGSRRRCSRPVRVSSSAVATVTDRRTECKSQRIRKERAETDTLALSRPFEQPADSAPSGTTISPVEYGAGLDSLAGRRPVGRPAAALGGEQRRDAGADDQHEDRDRDADLCNAAGIDRGLTRDEPSSLEPQPRGREHRRRDEEDQRHAGEGDDRAKGAHRPGREQQGRPSRSDRDETAQRRQRVEPPDPTSAARDMLSGDRDLLREARHSTRHRPRSAAKISWARATRSRPRNTRRFGAVGRGRRRRPCRGTALRATRKPSDAVRRSSRGSRVEDPGHRTRAPRRYRLLSSISSVSRAEKCASVKWQVLAEVP